MITKKMNGLSIFFDVDTLLPNFQNLIRNLWGRALKTKLRPMLSCGRVRGWS